MPNFDDLMSELHDAGVVVEGEDAFVAAIESKDDWAVEFVELVTRGRKQGIQLLRTRMDMPTDERLHQIFRGYPFPSAKVEMVVQNIVAPARLER